MRKKAIVRDKISKNKVLKKVVQKVTKGKEASFRCLKTTYFYGLFFGAIITLFTALALLKAYP